MGEMLAAAQAAGAYGAALSGAGPSLVAFATSNAQAEKVRAAFAGMARELKLTGTVKILKLSARGAHVTS
jgi:homoserine kinase